jgi:RNA polymerase sigma-70 factor (ECF subfamily)
MSEGNSFGELVRRVRAGDAEATTELVRRYEPAIRMAVRARLTDPALRRLLDSLDICQSVLASFFLRAAAGQYELEQPGQLLRLLETMARNKLLKQVEKHGADKRDYQLTQPGGFDEGRVAAGGPSPSSAVAHQELLHEFRRRLSEQERRIADLRAQGQTWTEIGQEFGGNPDTIRMQFTRAIDRITRELGLED